MYLCFWPDFGGDLSLITVARLFSSIVRPLSIPDPASASADLPTSVFFVSRCAMLGKQCPTKADASSASQNFKNKPKMSNSLFTREHQQHLINVCHNRK